EKLGSLRDLGRVRFSSRTARQQDFVCTVDDHQARSRADLELLAQLVEEGRRRLRSAAGKHDEAPPPSRRAGRQRELPSLHPCKQPRLDEGCLARTSRAQEHDERPALREQSLQRLQWALAAKEQLADGDLE